nr:glycosyltransferase [Acinetobacter haemolyticus]
MNEEPILGMVGRYDPQKNHKGLIEALAIVKNKGYNFKLILIGRDLNNKNETLGSQIKKYGLKDHIYLLDQRADIPNILNALDIHILSSAYGEGFPNVVAEAMVCGIPCVATNVGDTKLIINQWGEVVEPNDPLLLSDAIIKMINLRDNRNQWNDFKNNLSSYARSNFDLKIMVDKYNSAWKNIKEN